MERGTQTSPAAKRHAVCNASYKPNSCRITSVSISSAFWLPARICLATLEAEARYARSGLAHL